MKNNYIVETTVAVILVILLLFIINPFHFWMPNTLHMMVLGATIVAFGIFSAFILKEKVHDEREGAHRMLAGRVAFLSGSSVLILGIIVQEFSHNVDLWLPICLVMMIIAKILARVYSERNL
jgi:sugar phosphate permease